MAASPEYDPTEFQSVLRAWMERHGFSQMAAGQTVGISQGIINRWLKPPGDPYLVQPTIDSLEKIAPHVRIPMLELKRMTNNLTPADRQLLTAGPPDSPLDHRLESLLNELRAQWHVLGDEDKQQAEDVTRVAFRLHHARTRKSRQSRTEKGPDDSPRRRQLMVA